MDGVTRTNTSPGETVHQEPVVTRRARTILQPLVLVVGASTGGPQALTLLVNSLAPIVSYLPVCVTLHMPADLMPLIAAHVERTCGVRTHVVRDTQDLVPGLVYFAPGNRHLEFLRRNVSGVDLRLKSGTPRDSCRPAVDVMFASAAACYGARTLAVVLSGMGDDGLAGARAIVAAGGSVIVQDKASSAVWGMPGAVAKAELATAVMAPAALADEIIRRVCPPARSA